MKHADVALRRPVTTLMITVALALIGLVGARLLPLEQFPDITFPFMGVEIPYPGSTPDEIEEVITRPVEDALSTLPGIKQIQSFSNGDSARFQIEFQWGTDTDAAAFEVRSKLDAIRGQLPKAANRMLIFTASSADQPILTIRLSAERDLSSQYDVIERNLKKPLERLDGVARVQIAGVEPQEVRVLVDSGRMAAHGIDVRELVKLLERSNFSVSAGQITAAGQRLAVRPVGELRSVAEVGELLVRGTIRVRDLADVSLVSPELTLRRNLNGHPAVGVDIFKSTQANIVEVADRAMAVVENARLAPQMQGITLLVIGNQATSIRSSLRDVGESGVLGGMFALIILYLFLRHWPTTFFVSLAVPLSLLITLAAMYFMNLSINVMTMMGMMLAIGMLVDNAVVVTESVFRHRQMNPSDPRGATLAGVREVGIATLAGTATSVVVFLPILFGERNQMTIFLTHVALPIVVAMIASLLIAQTLVPMLTSRFPAPPPTATGSWIRRLQDRYVDGLRWFLEKNRRLLLSLGVMVVATVALLVASAKWPDQFLKVDMFPQDAGRQIVLDYRIDGSHPIERVAAAVEQVESFLEKQRVELEIDNIYSRFDAESAVSLLQLVPKERAKLRASEVIARLSGKLPEIIIGKPSFQLEQEGGSDGLSIQISGESTERLAIIAADLARVLAKVEGIDTARSDARNGDAEVEIEVDRARAAALGLSPQQVAVSVAAAMRGDRLRELRAPEREYTLRLAFRANDKQNVADLANLPLYLPSGARITLGSVAEFRVSRGARIIERVNRLTSVAVRTTLAKDASLNAVKERVDALLKSYSLPAGYSWKFGRGVEQDDEAQQVMTFNLLIAIAMIYLVMAAVFESSALPLSIITSILLAVVGVLWTLFLTRTTLTFMALIGIQILMGVVVNIGIVLVAHINDLRQAGMQRLDAILQAGRDRLRPILMTTATTVLGLLPLAVGDSQLAVGTAGPSYAPMARTIMGGLAFGAITSLFVVPVFYIWLDNARGHLARLWRRTAPTTSINATEP